MGKTKQCGDYVILFNFSHFKTYPKNISFFVIIIVMSEQHNPKMRRFSISLRAFLQSQRCFETQTYDVSINLVFLCVSLFSSHIRKMYILSSYITLHHIKHQLLLSQTSLINPILISSRICAHSSHSQIKILTKQTLFFSLPFKFTKTTYFFVNEKIFFFKYYSQPVCTTTLLTYVFLLLL